LAREIEDRLDSPEEQVGPRRCWGYYLRWRCEGPSMKRLTAEFLLAFALWVPGLFAYVGSLALPWFNLSQGAKIQVNRRAVPRADFDRSQAVITGRDAFDFLLERLGGGCFVWLAHPILGVGWLLLVCRRWRGASVAGCLALVLALNAPFVFQPREGPWLPPGVGYYLWFGSMALLACSAFLRGLFIRSDPIADNESFRRLAAREGTSAAELADLKQQVAALFDHQAVTFLEEIEAREPCESTDV